MDIERRGAVALVRMNAGKANAIGAAFLDRMDTLLDELEQSRPRAMVLTGHGRAFSAGLDLPSLIDLPAAQLMAFIRRFTEFMLRLFALPWPVVAAVNGHAVAGGCVLALQADQRLMAAGDGVIGLNEVRLGIGLPTVVVETLRCQVPATSLFPIAGEGGLFPAAEAHRLGLVHEVVPPETLVDRAHQRDAGAGDRGLVDPRRHARLDDLERRDLARQIEQHAVQQVVVAADETQRPVRRLGPGLLHRLRDAAVV